MKINYSKWFVLLLLFKSLNSQAQFKLLPVTNNDLRNNLQKVIADFPNQLSSIKGDVMMQNPQSTEYASTLNFAGAEENSITQYNSSKPVYSWQATILTTEDFETAAKKYKWLYNQVKVMTIKMKDGITFSLAGEYDEPDESKKFSTSTFRLLPAASNLPKLKVDVALQFVFPEWKVNLLVYQKDREDNERGDINDQ